MTTKELIAKSFVELSNVKSVDKITIRSIVDNRRFIINALKNTSGQNSFLCYVSQIHVTALRELICSTIGSKELPLRVETLLKLYVLGTVHLVCKWLIDKMPISIEEFATVLAAGLPSELKQYLPERVDLTN